MHAIRRTPAAAVVLLALALGVAAGDQLIMSRVEARAEQSDHLVITHSGIPKAGVQRILRELELGIRHLMN